MPRPPRPVDPDDGPLQSFANDLRELREKAGNPTYRVMAKKAGYSATTLSEAAGGVRRPTLDVTLAYVGVCGGDLDSWRLRWHDLSAAETVPVTESGPTAPPAQPRPNAPAPPPRSALRWALTGAVIALIAMAVMVSSVRAAGFGAATVGGCPAVHPAATFTGRTYLFTRVRSAPTLAAPVLRTIPADCTVGFAGFCLGDAIIDETAGTPDTRWLMLPGGGVVSAAVIHGNPPGTLAPSDCVGGSAPPAKIVLGVEDAPTDDRELSLRATGIGLQIVGFAALYADGSKELRWHQIGFTGPAPRGFDLRWHPNGLPRPSGGLTLAAVACLGGDGATRVADAKLVGPGASHRVAEPSLPRETLDAATRVACEYPDGTVRHSSSPGTASPS